MQKLDTVLVQLPQCSMTIVTIVDCTLSFLLASLADQFSPTSLAYTYTTQAVSILMDYDKQKSRSGE